MGSLSCMTGRGSGTRTPSDHMVMCSEKTGLGSDLKTPCGFLLSLGKFSVLEGVGSGHDPWVVE